MRISLCLTALLTLLATSGFAQGSARPSCDGTLTLVRVSEIKPGGTMDGFMSAVAANKAWYRANGVDDNDVFAARVLVRDPNTNEQKYSDSQVMTYHVNPPSRQRTPNVGDAGWNAFVKLYRDNSDMKAEYLACMPKIPGK